MIYGEDPLLRRSGKSTAREIRWEACVLMTTKLAEWACEHGQITKIRLSDGCGGKAITTAAQFENERHGIEGYLRNVG